MSFFAPLANNVFRGLFLAQLISLLGTGLTTVALALLAYELNPGHAGAVLGSALAVKMLAYLSVAPVVGGYIHRLPRKGWLLGLNIGRALLVALLPFVNEIWQLFVLIFLLNGLAAGYTPVYQALLPDILPDEQEYTQALSLSRFAMEMESMLSPALAAVLLIYVPSSLLFQLNAVGFVLALLLVMSVAIPSAAISERTGGVWHHVSFGIRCYLKTPRLRAVLALNMALSAAGAMVIVNTVVYVRSILGLDEQQVPLVMIAAGIGSMAVAFALPKILETYRDRAVMLFGGGLFVLALAAGMFKPSYIGLFPIWFVIGSATSLVLIPTGRVLRDSCNPGDRNDYFAANFALTHAMWFFGYLAAGWIGSQFSMTVTFFCMGLMAALATLAAALFWSIKDQAELWHEHPETDHLHPHVHDKHHQHIHEGWEGPEPHVHPHHHHKQRHRHAYVIDEHHLQWPRQ